jgi:hypothetical protein
MSKVQGKKFEAVDDGQESTTAVAAAPETTAVVTTAEQQKAAIAHKAAWCKIRHGVGAWQPADGEPPAEIGSVYISRGAQTGYRRLMGPGEANAVKFIGCFVREGVMEDVAPDGPMPRRWRVGLPDPVHPERTPQSLKECIAFAAEAGLSQAQTVPDGVYQDSGRVKYKRIPMPGFTGTCGPLIEFFGLAKIPETFTSNDFDLAVVGGELYTPIVFEFAKHHYKKAANGLKSIVARMYAAFAAKPENKGKPWKFDLRETPVVFRLGTTMVKRSVGNSTYPAPLITVRTGDALDEAALADLQAYFDNVTLSADDSDAGDGEL